MDNQIRLVVITGVSASGKTTLMEMLVKLFSNIRFIQSVTTRLRRATDTDADYEFLPLWKFICLWLLGSFIKVVRKKKSLYGVRVVRIKEALADSANIYVRSLTPEVLLKWEAAAPGKILYIHLAAPSLLEACSRMLERGDMNEEEIMRRFSEEVNWERQIENLMAGGMNIHVIPVCTKKEMQSRVLEIFQDNGIKV